MLSTSRPLNVGSSGVHTPQHTLSRNTRSLAPPKAATVDGPPSTSSSYLTTSASRPAPVIINQETLKMHSATAEMLECIDSMQPYFESEVLPLLLPTADCWQPQDFLPSPESDGFIDQLADLQARTADLPDDILCVLVGDMITEEALPTYMAMLNTLDGVRDETGACQTPYARWTREWVAEENRHGDLLNKYLWLTGRVNMRAVESTIQRLIGSGMDPKTENNAYLCFIFTSFQERATKVSHGGTARLAKLAGDETLAKICGVIAADEGRHEIAYTRTVDGIFKRDPNGAMLAFADMMRKKIVMPAHYMDDGLHCTTNDASRNLFNDFSFVAEDLGVYTAEDYVSIMEHLIDRWDVNSLAGLSTEALQAQEYVCSLPSRFRKLADRKEMRRSTAPRNPVKFSWLFDRELALL